MSQDLVQSFGAMGIQSRRPGHRVRLTEADQERLDQDSYRRIKEIVQRSDAKTDPLVRNQQINRILNPSTGDELSAPMLLKIAVEFCAVLCPVRFTEGDAENLHGNARAKRMRELRLERWQGKHDVIAVSCEDLAWLADGILRVDHGIERRDRATLAKKAHETYQFCVQRDRRHRAQSAGPAGKAFQAPRIMGPTKSLFPSKYHPGRSASLGPFPAAPGGPAAAITAGGASAYRGFRPKPPAPRIDATLPPMTTGAKLRTKKKKKQDSDSSSSSSSSASDADDDSTTKKKKTSDSDNDSASDAEASESDSD